MFILGNLIKAIAAIIGIILNIYYWLILIRALISWVHPDPDNQIVRFLYTSTEPILQPIRRMFPPMGVDFSPMIAFLAIIFLQYFLVASLNDLSYYMRQPRSSINVINPAVLETDNGQQDFSSSIIR